MATAQHHRIPVWHGILLCGFLLSCGPAVPVSQQASELEILGEPRLLLPGIAEPIPTRPILRSYRLLIVTPEEFRSASLWLVAHKQTTGMSTLVRTVEQIESDPAYVAGRDVQEKIKLAIRALKQRYGVEYVLLLGDADKLPVRWMWLKDDALYGRRYQPTDLYYADLYDLPDDHAVNDVDDGAFDDWDDNGDGRFGEHYVPEGFARSWADLNPDRLDLTPDVAVGRIPASTVDEVLTAAQKIVNYEQTAERPWTRKMLMVTGDWDQPNAQAERIADTMEATGYDVTRRYHDPADANWHDAAKVTQREAQLRDDFADGYGFVSYIGHGSQHSWSGWYGDGNVALADNADRLPIVFASACSTALFHTADRLYRDTNGALYQCSANVLEGDATFVLEPVAYHPQWVRFRTVNLIPQHAIQLTADGLRIAEGVGDLFVRSDPAHDPAPYWRSLRSYNYPERYVRHQNFQGKLTEVSSPLEREDATFRVAGGLTGTGGAQEERVSFESWNYPGWYLVQVNGALLLRQRPTCDDDFDSRATFRVVAGLADDAAVSFESTHQSGRFIRHRNFQLYVESGSGALFEQDATFWLDASKHDPRPSYASFVRLGTSDYLGYDQATARVALTTLDGTDERRHATFRLLNGLASGDSARVSLEAIVEAPGGSRTVRSHARYFVRHADFALHLHRSRPALLLDQPEPAALQTPVAGLTVEVDSMAEAFVVHHERGAIAYIGAFTGAQWGAKTLNQHFFDEVAERRGYAILGDVWNGALGRFIDNDLEFSWGGWGPGATYDHLHKMMLFGDPSLRIGGLYE